jgi:hypothetical protein
MRTHQLENMQLSKNAFNWLKQKYQAVDSMDSEAYRSFLSEDCLLQFGNQPIVECNNEIIGGIKHFWAAIDALDHSFINVLGEDHYIVAEAMIDYTRKDGKVVIIPCVSIIERNESGLVSSIRIFIDTAPIFNNN